MRVVSLREERDYKERAIEYFQKQWADEDSMMVYKDCIENTKGNKDVLPQWYLLLDNEKVIGCAGLITNDFISRMDLYPWVCALFIEEKYRGNRLGEILLNKAKEDTKSGGFQYLYLCTDHKGYYEKFGFEYLCQGYHPWGETSNIFRSEPLNS